MGNKKKSHGGFRKGAGRRVGETRTVNLCGVRLRPSRLLAYQDVARANAVTVTTLLEMAMDVLIAKVKRNEVGVIFDALYEERAALDLDAVYAGYVKELKKRKGKKS